MKKIIHFILFSFLFLPFLNVNADSFNLSLNIDQTTYTYKDEVNAKLATSGLPSYGISSGQFYLTYDTNYYSFSCSDVTYKQNVSTEEIDCSESNGKIIILYIDNDGGGSPITNGEFITIPFKVKTSVNSTVSTTFALSGEGFAGVNGGTITDLTLSSNPTKTVSIEKEKDSDTYLKSLSITGYSISFSKNKYEYSIEVENDVTSITINVSANSSLSKVSGTGTKNISEGDNKFTLTVTAESGDKQNYIINVKRKIKENNENVNNNDTNNNNSNNNDNNNVDNSNGSNSNSESDRIEGTVDPVPTGVYSYILVFSVILIGSGFIYFKVIKKNKFPKI